MEIDLMARQEQQQDVFNYDDAPKGRELFPKMYCNLEFQVAEKRYGDDGRAYFHAEAAICPPHADGTEAFDQHPVFITWYVGTDDDVEADDPKTWSVSDKKGLDETARKRAVAHDMSVQNLITLLKAAKLTKGEGQGVAPWILFKDLEGEKVCCEFGVRNYNDKDGNARTSQTYTWHELGARDPMVMGRETRGGRRHEAPTPPARPVRAVEAEPADDAPETPRRAAVRR